MRPEIPAPTLAAYLYRMRISRVRACVICTPTNVIRMRNATYRCIYIEENTHTNNAGYSNGSSLSVEDLEIIDI